jgi:hypothetical protein
VRRNSIPGQTSSKDYLPELGGSKISTSWIPGQYLCCPPKIYTRTSNGPHDGLYLPHATLLPSRLTGS